MSDSSSEEETILVALALSEEEERKKRLWIHDINLSRNKEGEYHTLFPRLKLDNKRFFRYFRMSYEKFMELLCMIEPTISKQNTKFRNSISPEERLAVTLRYTVCSIKIVYVKIF